MDQRKLLAKARPLIVESAGRSSTIRRPQELPGLLKARRGSLTNKENQHFNNWEVHCALKPLRTPKSHTRTALKRLHGLQGYSSQASLASLQRKVLQGLAHGLDRHNLHI